MRPLRDYQSRAIAAVVAAARAGYRSILVVAPTGAGKTRLACELVSRSLRKRSRVLFVCHRAELIKQTVSSFLEEGIQSGVIAPWSPRTQTLVQCASIQTMLARGEVPDADMVILDECVAPGAIVGDQRAEDVRIGDLVGTPFGKAPVTYVWKRPAPETLVTIQTLSGRTLICTMFHPVWTTRGFVPASEVTDDDFVLPDTGAPHDHALLSAVWRDVQRYSAELQSAQRPLVTPGSLQGVPEGTIQEDSLGDHGNHQPDACKRENEGAQSDADRCCARIHGEDASIDRSQAVDPWRQREGIDEAASGSAHRVGPRMGGRARCSDGSEDKGKTTALQARPCTPDADDCDRGRWPLAQCAITEGARRPQGCLASSERLDRVARVERRSSSALGIRYVYDFEVAGVHCYFADGILSHNCHHYVSAEWGAIARQLRRALVVGLTATPERSDGAPLGDLFQILIPVAQPRELIASGHLVPTDVWSPPPMASGLMADPVEAFFDHPDTHANGRPKRTIVFGANVPHAQELAERFAARGLRTACVDGEMKWDDRIEAIERFSAGELDLLTNVYCLTEGLDVPAIEVIVLARGCGSQGTFIQMVGRGKRPSAGKTRSLLLDCKRAVYQHGLPDEDREYSLTGRAIHEVRLEPLRSCVRCGATFAAAGRLCPRCGAPVPRPATPEERKAKLEHVRQVATVSEKRSYLEWLQREAKRLGHSAGWCAHKFKGKYGHFPPVQMWRAA